MDPLSIAAACVGLLSGLTTVSTKIRSLTTDAKNTNKEVSALQSELDAFQRSLGVFYGSGLADKYPDHLRQDLDTIIRQCKCVVDEIDCLLDKVAYGHLSQQLQWSFSVRDEVTRLHRNLEGHKSAITIAIAFASMSMSNGIKSDTSSIRSKAARIPEIQNQLAAVLEAIDTLNNGDPSQRPQLSLAMQRFLQEAYTESISGSIFRSNSSKTSGTMLASTADPFEDPRSATEASVFEQPITEIDDGYDSGSTTSHSAAALSTNLDTPASHEATRQSLVQNSTLPPAPPKVSRFSTVFQPTAVASTTNLRKDSLPASNEYGATRKSRFSFARSRQHESPLTAVPDSFSMVSMPISRDSLLDLASALSVQVFEFMSRNDPAFEQSARDIYERGLTLALSTNNLQNDAAFHDAVQLHQSGKLEPATLLLKELAEQGHTLSQIMYALSLRHGWGCNPEPRKAMAYLYSATRVTINSELRVIDSGVSSTSMAPDELKLALFEIASSLRHGWDCTKSAVSARSFYKCAADLGDVDAMHELAWCFFSGFGGKKDKFAAAQVLRKAERQGSKVLGNSWIWKEKYDMKPW